MNKSKSRLTNSRRVSIGSRIPADLKEKAKEKADELGVSFASFIDDAVELLVSFDPFFWKRLKEQSEKLGIKEHIVIQNIMLAWMAKKEVEQEMNEKRFGRLPEFPMTPEGLVTGERLFKEHKDELIKQAISRKYMFLKHFKQRRGSISKEDEIWLKKEEERREKARQERDAKRRAALIMDEENNEDDI